jgi:hypothetical protein
MHCFKNGICKYCEANLSDLFYKLLEKYNEDACEFAYCLQNDRICAMPMESVVINNSKCLTEKEKIVKNII